MEAWRDELYHYGVKGMKWRHRKNNGSAIADHYNSNAQELAQDRSLYDSKEYKKWSVNKEKRLRRTAKAIQNGRPASRLKTADVGVMEKGKGLYRRGSGLGNRTTASGHTNQKRDLTVTSAKRSFKRKDRAAKYVKRVLK